MPTRDPFTFPHPTPGADQLSEEDKRRIAIVAELAAAIFARTAKENGFGDTEITRARKAAMASSPALSLTSGQPVLRPNPEVSSMQSDNDLLYVGDCCKRAALPYSQTLKAMQGDPSFPKPAVSQGKVKRWRGSEIDAWAAKHREK